MEEYFMVELESKLSKYRTYYEVTLKHLEESQKIVKRMQQQTNQMKEIASDSHCFLGMRQVNDEVNEILKSTSDFDVTGMYKVNIEIDPTLSPFLNRSKTFGNVVTEVTNIPLTQPNINQAQAILQLTPKSINDVGIELKEQFEIKRKRMSMCITGCAILPSGQLLVADYKGKKQLMQYNQDGSHVRDIPISGQPFDVTVIDSDRVAVSFGDSGYIGILHISRIKTEQLKIDFENHTWGLSYQGGQLYVVVSGNGIVVTTLAGDKLKTLKVNVDHVNYITATHDRIYYSDFLANTVNCCDRMGKKLWNFRDDFVVEPVGLTVLNNQNVAVAGCDSDNVTIISRDGETSKTLLTKSDGLHYPRVIYYSRETGDFLICNERDTKAAIFKVTF